jgi:RimJ/RimL family protein N-acetyltransferase
MSIFARRYDWQETSPLDSSALLDAFTAHPEFLAYPYPPEAARVIGASLLTDPNNVIWVTYSGGTLTGCVILTRVVANVDALLHFLFLDKDLSSKRTLLKNLIRHCFEDLGFHRLSMEVPEGIRLERFARKTLGFRLEGEIRDRNPELPKCLDNVWVAKQGSRREQSYFDGRRWSDVLLLRLLVGEVGGDEREGSQCRSDQPQQSLAPSPEPPPAASSVAEVPVTPNPSSPKTSKDSAART